MTKLSGEAGGRNLQLTETVLNEKSSIPHHCWEINFKTAASVLRITWKFPSISIAAKRSEIKIYRRIFGMFPANKALYCLCDHTKTQLPNRMYEVQNRMLRTKVTLIVYHWNKTKDEKRLTKTFCDAWILKQSPFKLTNEMQFWHVATPVCVVWEAVLWISQHYFALHLKNRQ